ncbi:biotin-dependent carboxyltransferase family protein [Shewanella litorisediminis]|uniref:Biotin-dependent carboxyltransferase family protein n=1 Tax=Shewanella litorisediminis TaxID=1173586 RepID=A0ABX7G3Z8_9GAMM|nr:biotin-dependent carboxyltransferase family protein [Shewanella litorisediminis]MCL2919942.1 biotin-dependent carboxyltransferase family protein [Shewanella litorisediminis]QRH01883.1 biotin-dependent carboxyltransferase family protein [Shewanella litorisediminis]
MLEVVQGGIQTTVQDLGRTGVAHLGLPRSGALDRQALLLANRLLGNPDNTPVLEFALGQSSLTFNRDAWIALTGADFNARIDTKPVWSGWRCLIKAGQTLSLRGPKAGMRAYLAVDGGIQVPLFMGSASTDLSSGVGGVEGRALKSGDRLELGPERPLKHQVGAMQSPWDNNIRVLPGPQYPLLDKALTLTEAMWQLQPSSNRMGARLEGPALRLSQPLEMASQGVFPGVMQLPPSGQPIVLLNDAQTTGGYPIVASVIEADLWKLAQARPGQSLQFVLVDRAEALAACERWKQYFYRLGRALGSGDGHG